MWLFNKKKKKTNEEPLVDLGVYKILSDVYGLASEFINVIDWDEDTTTGYLWDRVRGNWYNEPVTIRGLNFQDSHALKFISSRDTFVYNKTLKKKDVLDIAKSVLPGIIANPETAKQYMNNPEYKEYGDQVKVVCKAAIIYAETLLKEINKRYD